MVPFQTYCHVMVPTTQQKTGFDPLNRPNPAKLWFQFMPSYGSSHTRQVLPSYALHERLSSYAFKSGIELFCLTVIGQSTSWVRQLEYIISLFGLNTQFGLGFSDVGRERQNLLPNYAFLKSKYPLILA